MRVATWNVNSLRARLDKVLWWLGRAAPDVLLLQETKLADADAPAEAFRQAGYALAHHGQGRWNGVAIASRVGLDEVVVNFGAERAADPTPEVPDDQPLAEARMIAARCGDVRVVSLYAPNGREVGSPFYAAKLAWFDRLARWLAEAADPGEPLLLGGDFNVAPEDRDVWDPVACAGGTHVSPPEREAFRRLCAWGLQDAYRRLHPDVQRFTWWDYRGGNFHRNIGMRIDHVLLTAPLARRLAWAEVDREARKGKPVPSDHAPLVVDLDAPGRPFDPGWPPSQASRAPEGRTWHPKDGPARSGPSRPHPKPPLARSPLAPPSAGSPPRPARRSCRSAPAHGPACSPPDRCRGGAGIAAHPPHRVRAPALRPRIVDASPPTCAGISVARSLFKPLAAVTLRAPERLAERF
jgi:exodeoxyribonuclease-3